MVEALAFAYVTAVGFVLAGVLSSFVQLVSGEPMRFMVQHGSFSKSIWSVFLRIFAGPTILMRNAWRGMRLEARPKAWFGFSMAVAAFWSLCIGALALDVFLALIG